MKSFIIENKSKGYIRINVRGRESLVLKPGKQELEENILNIYKDGIAVWKSKGVINIVPVGEKKSTGKPSATNKQNQKITNN